jgi:putative cell wall-binding protein
MLCAVNIYHLKNGSLKLQTAHHLRADFPRFFQQVKHFFCERHDFQDFQNDFMKNGFANFLLATNFKTRLIKFTIFEQAVSRFINSLANGFS